MNSSSSNQNSTFSSFIKEVGVYHSNPQIQSKYFKIQLHYQLKTKHQINLKPKEEELQRKKGKREGSTFKEWDVCIIV